MPWHLLDQLLGLDVGHTVHTGDTITIKATWSANCVQLNVPELNCAQLDPSTRLRCLEGMELSMVGMRRDG